MVPAFRSIAEEDGERASLWVGASLALELPMWLEDTQMGRIGDGAAKGMQYTELFPCPRLSLGLGPLCWFQKVWREDSRSGSRDGQSGGTMRLQRRQAGH